MLEHKLSVLMAVQIEQIHDAEVGKVSNAGVSKKKTINERKVPEFFSKPVNRKDVRAEKEYNCTKCDFQGTRQLELNKHINLKQGAETQKETIKCYHCDEQFSTKWNLMNHRKYAHPNDIAICKNSREGNCSFSDETCLWSHAANQKKETFKCFVCDKVFESKVKLMVHRKSLHEETIKTCNKYLSKSCRYKNETCWFKHDEKEMNVENTNEEVMEVKDNNTNQVNDDASITIELVFQKVFENLKPPFQNN